MECPPSYMETSEAAQAFRRVFCGLHQVSEPNVPLGSCPQWSATTSGKIKVSLESDTHFIGGYFLNTSSAIPSMDNFRSLIANRQRQLIVPNVRQSQNTEPLKSAGFIPVPAGDESLLYVGQDWEKQIRESHGAESLYELRKSKRRSDAFSNLITYPIRQCPDSCLDRLAMLLGAHEDRYGHANHLFTRRYLELMKNDEKLGPKTYVAERMSNTGESIQAMIWIESGDTLFYVTQASDRSRIDSKINVYKASYADVYSRANERQLAWTNISRGNSELKRRLGATVQIPQFHWIRPSGSAV